MAAISGQLEAAISGWPGGPVRIMAANFKPQCPGQLDQWLGPGPGRIWTGDSEAAVGYIVALNVVVSQRWQQH